MLMGGSSSEREVSINSGKNVLNALRTGNNLQRYIAVSIAFRQPQELIKKLEKMLGFEIGLGTINLGNPFVSSGIIANSFGFAVGEASSGFEISRVDESLGFLK